MSKNKTTTEAQLRAWREAGKTAHEIAALLGRSKSSIDSAYMVLGIHGMVGRANQHTPEALASYVEKLRRGYVVREIAADAGVTGTTIRKALKRAGLPTTAREVLRRQAKKAD